MTLSPPRAETDPVELPAPVARVRKLRAPWLTAGALLIALAVIAAVIVYGRVAARDQYLAVAHQIGRGEEVTREHLGLIAVGTDAPLTAFRPAQADEVIGKRALADLQPGTLVSPDLVSMGELVPEGMTLVGLVVRPGEYPTVHLTAGDWLSLVKLPGTTFTVDPDGEPDDGPQMPFEAARVEAYSVLPVGTGTQRFVTVLVPVELAAVISAYADAGELRLVQVREDTPPLVFTDPAMFEIGMPVDGADSPDGDDGGDGGGDGDS